MKCKSFEQILLLRFSAARILFRFWVLLHFVSELRVLLHSSLKVEAKDHKNLTR